MGYTYYRVEMLIPADMPLTFLEIVRALQVKFSSLSTRQVVVSEKHCEVRHNGWALRIHWEEEAGVVDEIKEFVYRKAANRPDQARIASFNRLVTTAADPDPNMDYFNDYVFVLEVLENFAGTYLFDPNNGTFIEPDKNSNG
jgi:hypothetical protein